MIAFLLAAQIFVVQAPPAPPKEEAARILAQAPGLSNRTNWHPIVEGPRVLVLPAPTATSQPVERTVESDQSRATRMGIPGGWTPLEFAILNSGAQK